MEGMRGLSALLVFFVHFYGLFGAWSQSGSTKAVFRFLATLGHCGVDVFFALSGFIIYGLLLTKHVAYLGFIRRRLIRLYPAFTAIFVIYLFLNLLLPSYSRLSGPFLSQIIYVGMNFLMLPGIFPIPPMITVAWSLSYELCFYITLPLIYRWFKMAMWPRSARILFWLVICGVHLGLNRGVSSHPRLIMFGCGILLRETLEWRIRWNRWGLASIAALGLFLVSLTLTGLRNSVVFTELCGPVLQHSNIILMTLWMGTYAISYFALGDRGDWLARCFSWDWLRWFGNISYSYYLAHGLILHFCKAGFEFLHVSTELSTFSFLALCLFSFGMTVAGSAALFLAVEKRYSLSRRPAAQVHKADGQCTELSLGAAG